SLEPVPAIYHICSAWALAHGAVALMQSPFYQRLIEDKDDFLDFLIEIGIRMGNKGQRGK
ncbi:MAG TPA: TetR/AcrR family transcriptional regulator, partial [Alcanivorax sp.]|nr:TetR/AcrR family transcriptional regulator [Alcanivorax sp.]